MKTNKRVLAFISALLVVGSVKAFAAAEPRLITYMPDAVFAPSGFDDNDNAQVVLDGLFPNTCYKVGPQEVSVDKAAKKIVIQDMVYHYNALCAMMMVPYQKTIELGVLSEGNYDIFVRKDDGAVKKMAVLPVAKAPTGSADDFLYAVVTDVSVDGIVDGHPVLTVKGLLTNTCQSLKEVRVAVRPGNVVEVLPITELSGTGCQNAENAFEVTQALVGMPAGKTLVHVRSLNGQAVNKVVTFY